MYFPNDDKQNFLSVDYNYISWKVWALQVWTNQSQKNKSSKVLKVYLNKFKENGCKTLGTSII